MGPRFARQSLTCLQSLCFISISKPGPTLGTLG